MLQCSSNKTLASKKLQSSIIFQLSLLLTLLAAYSCLFFILRRPLVTKIVACNVGQGDAILILYGHKRILIDSGPNIEVLRCFPRVTFSLLKNIDSVILSHWDKDHIGGFAPVLQNYIIGAIFANPPLKETQVVANLEQEIEKRGGSVKPQVGDQIIYPGMRVRFLWNQEMLTLVTRQKAQSDENAGSIAVQIHGKSFGFLGMGDLECAQELAVLTLPLLNPYQILKVSHHGAKTSSCLEFFEKMRPEIAIISSGVGNSYGHPALQTLGFLEKMRVFPMRTDELGTFSLTKIPRGWQVGKH